MNQLVGRFPIFGKSSKTGELADTRGTVISNSFPSYYMNNKLAYEQGFKTEPSKEQLNGMFNFITSALSDLYTRGIPPFTLNLAYPKGAVVSFNGNLYVSLTDGNTTHVSQPYAWGKIQHVTNEPTKKTDDLPIGTILTVPMATKREGYIDYVEGKEFSPTTYPELYQILGTNTFSYSNASRRNDLPIGSILHYLSASTDLPDGFIEWDNKFGSLRHYPELKAELERVANRIQDNIIRSMWLDSLANNTLPLFQDFYLGLGSVGYMVEDSIKQTEITTIPVVLDYSNTLNPLGLTRCVAEERTYPVVASQNVSRQPTNSNVLVTGMRADQYSTDVDKRLYTITVGNGTVTRPKTLFTRVLIKATNPRPSAISSTHKQIIKAYN